MMNKLRHETNFGMNTVRWQKLCVPLHQQNAIAGIDSFNEKKKSVFLLSLR